jgi:hypothetical protein
MGSFMPRLKDEILDCVVYLYSSFSDAESGNNIGGSGFVVQIPCEKPEFSESSHIYAVTNRHVIDDGFSCVRFNTQDGRRLVVEAKPSDWIVSQTDDLAVAPMPEMPIPVAANAVLLACLLTQEEIAKHDIGVGDDVIMLGRFINREGIQKNSPTARFGHIAQMPGDPIEFRRKGKLYIQDLAFLCEVKSIGGYSGSPVFLMPNPTYSRGGEPLPKDRGVVIGVDFCHIRNFEHPLDASGIEMTHMHIPVNTGMAGVIPAWRLRELIMSDKALKQRRNAEEAQSKKKKPPAASADSAASNVPPATDENPNHRGDFMRLVGAAARKPVPKD